MKKLMIATLLVAVFGTSAFASDAEKISYRVTTNFEAKFAGAKNVRWLQQPTYVKVTFELNDETVEAFYSADGETLGYSRKIDLKKLPLSAISKIKKDYASFVAKEVIEFDRDGERTFYVSLTDGNKTQILEVSPYGNVSTYKGVKQ